MLKGWALIVNLDICGVFVNFAPAWGFNNGLHPLRGQMWTVREEIMWALSRDKMGSLCGDVRPLA